MRFPTGKISIRWSFNAASRALCAVLIAVSATTGCRSIKEKRRARFAAVDASARRDFREGDYAAAAEKLKEAASIPTPEEPLYRIDRASALLLLGKTTEARRELMAAHRSIDAAFDLESEKRAGGVWGKESEKLYKGDPYERCLLYFMLSLCLLEEGDADNALAALKTGLLADSDSEKGTYKSDFALLMFMAAKCCDIRGEPELRDEYLDAAFNAWLTFPGNTKWFAERLTAVYDSFQGGKPSPKGADLSPTLLDCVAIGKKNSLADALMKRNVPEKKASEMAAFGKRLAEGRAILDFNVLVVIWRGSPPDMRRVGRYGEKRVIIPGNVDNDTVYEILLDGEEIKIPMDEFGDITYQATTRGGRKMDQVLSRQAFYKTATNTSGNAIMMAAAATRSAPVALGLLAAGLIMKITAVLMHPEADIRHWGNLPYEFDILPLKLAPGEHVLALERETDATTEEISSKKITITEKTPFASAHFRVP